MPILLNFATTSLAALKRPRGRSSRLGGVAAVLPLVSAVLMALSGHAASQAMRTIKIVVPFAPGGAASVMARLVADQISQMQGLTVVVENRPGGSTVIGTEAVARSSADGNTLLVTNPAIVINPHLRKQDYDPLTSFEPICNLVSAPSFIAVNSASPYRTLAEFVDVARAKPGQLTLATFPATGTHIAFEMLKHRANVDITFIPYSGSAPAVTALLGGHVTSMADNYATMAEHVNAGKLRALATFSRNRIEALPSIPTVAESGYEEYEGWFGLFAPANAPKEAVSRLIRWTTSALQVPEVRQKLEPLGLYPISMCGAAFATLLRKQYVDFGRIIREANIKAE
jgi:tripartite-type tricarboxylate transporter receptor subunit TctC